MNDKVSIDPSVPHNVLHPLLIASGSSNLDKALESLIETSNTSEGRLNLASKHIILKPVLQLCQFFLNPFRQELLFLSLKLLRNLCVFEKKNQNLFIKNNGAGILSSIASSRDVAPVSDDRILRTVLQVLGNVSLSGEKRQLAVWSEFFPLGFLNIARIRSEEICELLFMVIYTCSGGGNQIYTDLSEDTGIEFVTEMILIVMEAGFKDDWLKLFLSRICLQEPYFSSVFSKISVNKTRDKDLRIFADFQSGSG